MSKVLEDDAVHDIGNVFAGVRCRLDDFVQFFPLDDFKRIETALKELAEESMVDLVGFVFDSL